MHNLHIILINAESAAEAADTVTSEIESFGNENNWRCIGGVAGENGDNIINHDDGRWGLDHYDNEDGTPPEEGYFKAIIKYVYADVPSAEDIKNQVRELGKELSKIDMDLSLYIAADKLKELYEYSCTRNAIDEGQDFPDLNGYEYDKVGFTNMSEAKYYGEKSKNPAYIVLVDMHS